MAVDRADTAVDHLRWQVYSMPSSSPIWSKVLLLDRDFFGFLYKLDSLHFYCIHLYHIKKKGKRCKPRLFQVNTERPYVYHPKVFDVWKTSVDAAPTSSVHWVSSFTSTICLKGTRVFRLYTFLPNLALHILSVRSLIRHKTVNDQKNTPSPSHKDNIIWDSK